MVKNNPFGIIDSLANNLNDKVNRRNEQLLTNLGKALELGPDSVYTIAIKEIEILPGLIIPERNIHSGQVITAISQISNDYAEKEYIQAINDYNTLHNIFDADELKNGPARFKVNEARFAAGSAVLWNRGNLHKVKDVFPPGTWAHKALQTVLAGKKPAKRFWNRSSENLQIRN